MKQCIRKYHLNDVSYPNMKNRGAQKGYRSIHKNNFK